MPRTRDLWRRFRRVAAPGAVARPGVPEEGAAALEAELLPVLDLLSPVLDEAEDIRQRGHREAERRRRDAEQRASALLTEARTHGEEDRAEAATALLRTAAEEAATVLATARASADAMAARGQGLTPEYVDLVLAEVRHRLGLVGP